MLIHDLLHSRLTIDNKLDKLHSLRDAWHVISVSDDDTAYLENAWNGIQLRKNVRLSFLDEKKSITSIEKEKRDANLHIAKNCTDNLFIRLYALR